MLLDERKPDDFTFDDDLDDLDDLEAIAQYNSQSNDLQTIDISKKVDVKEIEKYDDDTSILSEIFSYIKILIAAVILALIINHFIIINATIPTGSMTNTIMEGDHIIGFRLAYVFSEPERGDIVIFDYPDDPSQKYVKRVIGLPGDIVEIRSENNTANVYVNGKLLNEPYLKEPMTPQNFIFIVPSDSYFVLGDNRNDSKDSRFWKNTFVTKDAIHAKAIMKYLSNSKINIDFFESYSYE